ncbi:MAG TPA: sulfite exporter TauE/SafE family protein [Coriobacteriia bacterium]|jgi:hypothetical protein
MAAFWVKAAVVGLVAGVLSGMFGIGGGIITTPAIRLLLGGSAIAAVASSLPAIIPSALTGAFSYARRGIADVRGGLQVGTWGAAFAVAGAYLTRFIGGSILLIVTAAIIGYMAVDMALLALRAREPGEEPPVATCAEEEAILAAERPAPRVFRPTPGALAVVGAVTGLYSGLLGLGGGFVIVPVLTRWFGFSAKRAIGTSLVAIAILSVPATVTHALLGHIDWRIALALSVMVVPGSLIGSRITAAASERGVRVGFAALLVAAGLVLAANEVAVLVR